MNVLIAVKGNERETFYARVAALLPPGADIAVVHVVDERLREEMRVARESHLLHRPLGRERDARLGAAEEAAGRRVLERSKTALAEILPDLDLQVLLLHGKPKDEIVRVVASNSADLVIVGGRPGERPGPKSVGKTARFVLDHVQCAALLIRY